MIINAISHTVKNIWIAFLLIVLSVIIFIIALINGIEVDNISLPYLKAHQLYIKLDKKLIVRIQTVEVNKKSNVDSSLEESAQIIKNFPYLHQFFHQINIEHLLYGGEHISLHYEQERFMIDTKYLNANLYIKPIDDLHIEIDQISGYFKDHGVKIQGKSQLDLKAKKYTFDGQFDFLNLTGNISLNIDKNLLTYRLNSNSFNNKTLTDVVNYIAPIAELDPIAKDWIHKNIVAKEYVLHSFEGKLNIDTLDYFPYEMQGSATAKNALVKFEPTVPAASVKEIGIVFKDDKLIFDIKEPIYEKKPIKKADVHIYNLIGKGTGIVVDLNATAKLDQSIHKILHAFHIDVPINQTSGKTDAQVRLDIKFLPYDINATGTFTLHPSDFTLGNLAMSTRSGKVHLDNYLVKLDKTNLIYKKLFNIEANGIFDTKSSSFDGAIDIKNLLVDFGGLELLKIDNIYDQPAYFSVDKNDTITMGLPNFEAKMLFENKNNQFFFPNLSKIVAYSPTMKQGAIKEGAVKVSTVDFENFSADISVKNFPTPLLEGNKTVDNFDISLKTNGKIVDASTLDKKLSLHYGEDELTLHINDLNISIPEDDNSPLDVPIKTTVAGERVNFIDLKNNKKLLSDSFMLTLHKNAVRLVSHKNRSTLEYEKQNNNLMINAKNLDATSTNTLLKRRFFQGGEFSLTLDGKSDTQAQGDFSMHQTNIKDLKFFNNLMATINTIPSLIVFSDPHFDKEGYFVENGYIEFAQNGDIMVIKELRLQGRSTDILGSGTIDLKTNAADLKLDIKTLKSFGSMLDKIPLIGGLILGSDKKISTRVDVTGDITDPTITIHLVADTLMSPLNILKRTLELPLELFK